MFLFHGVALSVVEYSGVEAYRRTVILLICTIATSKIFVQRGAVSNTITILLHVCYHGVVSHLLVSFACQTLVAIGGTTYNLREKFAFGISLQVRGNMFPVFLSIPFLAQPGHLNGLRWK